MEKSPNNGDFSFSGINRGAVIHRMSESGKEIDLLRLTMQVTPISEMPQIDNSASIREIVNTVFWYILDYGLRQKRIHTLSRKFLFAP